MKIVLTVFAPILVAIAVRIALFLIGLIVGLLLVSLLNIDAFANFADDLMMFDPFAWDESWGYWILVAIGSFLAEMAIWGDD